MRTRPAFHGPSLDRLVPHVTFTAPDTREEGTHAQVHPRLAVGERVGDSRAPPRQRRPRPASPALPRHSGRHVDRCRARCLPLRDPVGRSTSSTSTFTWERRTLRRSGRRTTRSRSSRRCPALRGTEQATELDRESVAPAREQRRSLVAKPGTGAGSLQSSPPCLRCRPLGSPAPRCGAPSTSSSPSRTRSRSTTCSSTPSGCSLSTPPARTPAPAMKAARRRRESGRQRGAGL